MTDHPHTSDRVGDATDSNPPEPFRLDPITLAWNRFIISHEAMKLLQCDDVIQAVRRTLKLKQRLQVAFLRGVEAGRAAEQAEVTEKVIALLLNWRSWYDEKIFTELAEGETQKVHEKWPGIVDRISASSARNTVDNILKDLSAGKLQSDDDYE